MTKIKICGIYRDEDTQYINDAEPNYFGMIINFPKSHRSIDKAKADAIRRLVRNDIPAVGVFVDQDFAFIKELLDENIIDIAQLHGHESDEMILKLKQETGKAVWKAFKIRNSEDIKRAEESSADLILLDNGYGTGECFDWSLIGDIDRKFALAGGLRLDNMSDAIEQIKPYMIDISSGVETERKKDREKIITAVNIVRNT